MSKYPIKKEFFPYSHFTPPIRNAKMAGKLGSLMKPPKWIWKDPEVAVHCEVIHGYREQPIKVLIFEPHACKERMSCLVYYHGGGFFFEGAGYHYKLAKEYALKTPCKVAFVQYRLAPIY